MWFAIDTLEYLRKGGRIGAAQAWLGSALQIKPILTLEEEITPVERVRTRRRAFERMVEFARERKRAGAGAWVVQHIHDPDTARKLVDECRQIFGSRPGLRLRDRPRDRRPRRPRPARLRRDLAPSCWALVRARLAAAAQRHHAADGEADDGGADDQLAAVLADLAAPVGELGDAAAQRLDRVRELLALTLDVGADLARAAPRRAGRGPGDRLAGAAVDARSRRS